MGNIYKLTILLLNVYATSSIDYGTDVDSYIKVSFIYTEKGNENESQQTTTWISQNKK